MAKPLYIDGLTQAQRTRYVRCAALNGQKLNEWVADTLDREADRLLAFEQNPISEPIESPLWAAGLSTRAFFVLKNANLNNRDAVVAALTEWTPATWYSLPNCGHKIYEEVTAWINS